MGWGGELGRRWFDLFELDFVPQRCVSGLGIGLAFEGPQPPPIHFCLGSVHPWHSEGQLGNTRVDSFLLGSQIATLRGSADQSLSPLGPQCESCLRDFGLSHSSCFCFYWTCLSSPAIPDSTSEVPVSPLYLPWEGGRGCAYQAHGYNPASHPPTPGAGQLNTGRAPPGCGWLLHGREKSLGKDRNCHPPPTS